MIVLDTNVLSETLRQTVRQCLDMDAVRARLLAVHDDDHGGGAALRHRTVGTGETTTISEAVVGLFSRRPRRSYIAVRQRRRTRIRGNRRGPPARWSANLRSRCPHCRHRTVSGRGFGNTKRAGFWRLRIAGDRSLAVIPILRVTPPVRGFRAPLPARRSAGGCGSHGVAIAPSAMRAKSSGPICTAPRLRGMPRPAMKASSASPASSPGWPIAAATSACRSALAGLFQRITAGSMMHEVCPCGMSNTAPST